MTAVQLPVILYFQFLSSIFSSIMNPFPLRSLYRNSISQNPKKANIFMNIQTVLFLMRSHVRVGLAITEKPAGGNGFKPGCGTGKIPRSGLRGREDGAYFLKLSFRETLRLKTRWSAVQWRLSMQK